MASPNGESKMPTVENGEEKVKVEEEIAKLKIGEEEKLEPARESKTVTVKIGESKFEVDEEAAEKWKKTTKTDVIEEDRQLSFLKITTSAFSKIVEYKKMQQKKSGDELNEWVSAFAEKIDDSDFLFFIDGAYILEEVELLKMLCEIFADRIKKKSVSEVRAIFKEEKVYTDEEEAALRKENAWAFE